MKLKVGARDEEVNLNAHTRNGNPKRDGIGQTPDTTKLMRMNFGLPPPFRSTSSEVL